MSQETIEPIGSPPGVGIESPRLAQVAFAGRPAKARWLAEGLEREFLKQGHELVSESEEPGLVLNFTEGANPRPFRRRSQGMFVVTVVEVEEEPADILRAAYPVLVRSLSNLLIYITHRGGERRTHFITLEQGYYTVGPPDGDREAFFAEAYRRLAPLASSRLAINNTFTADMPPELWKGDEVTRSLIGAGRRLDRMDLLPAPFPIEELLDERELNHVHRLFGIGGLSYGNLSARKDGDRFWMTARGVDKSNLGEVGRDILLVTGYDREANAMRVSVPPHVEPRPASVDAIEHWALYAEHPEVGAIIHVHAWMEGIPSTSVNYPCGTYELAREVAELARLEPDPSRAVIGLKNHGLTITGHDLEEIFERIEGKILPQVPMS